MPGAASSPTSFADSSCGIGCQDTTALMQAESHRRLRAKERIPFELRVVVNPVLSFPTEETALFEEACLSVPGYAATVRRFKEVIVSGFDQNGKAVEWHATGWAARILQHEVDHLDGKIYIDRAETGSQYKVLPGMASGEKRWLVAIAALVVGVTAWANQNRQAIFAPQGSGATKNAGGHGG